jgi:hypothetical protein
MEFADIIDAFRIVRILPYAKEIPYILDYISMLFFWSDKEKALQIQYFHSTIYTYTNNPYAIEFSAISIRAFPRPYALLSVLL